MDTTCDVGEGNCISDDECKNDLVCNDCRGSSHADECCQDQSLQGCWRPDPVPHGDWDCPGDIDSEDIEVNHTCLLNCDNDSFGGYLVCLGHG
eukprot:TRINITY_DN19554_c0_g1_i1.p2 TRINITY_DN19554_c0_g1~~TRINITY_DN19554_c0_g1_i1.p2  ORF type:complete len:100 (-),score=23.46 TRINITY_DN19554_c0_g1_i1:163-441(-)